ncbi:MAG: ABC transporter substrate-binding protein [Promethearchaeota archaeon]
MAKFKEREPIGTIFWVSIILNVVLFVFLLIIIPPYEIRTYAPPRLRSFIFATKAGPIDMDPHLCYDNNSEDVISQICEGLYKFDVTNPGSPLLPVLSTTLPTVEGTPDKPELVIPLRQGVKFQDGTNFNAATVKWNFDRLMYFMNYSGNQYLPSPFNVSLPTTTQVTKVYLLFDQGGIPVINETIVEDTYIVRIKMNFPKASFINQLAFHSCFFHSPTSAKAQGKELDYLTYADDDKLIGTGPFMLDYYTTDVEVKFSANLDYWQTPKYLSPKIEELTFWIIEDDIALNTAILNGDIDLYDEPEAEFLEIFEADPDITLLEAGPTVNTEYLGFNGYMVNTTFRKAISYAINYSYLIDVVMASEGYRLKSPIPEGIPMSNFSFNYPLLNRTYAQSIMQSMGYGTTFTADVEWLAVADVGGWGFGWNITAQTEEITHRDFAFHISENLRYLGMNVPVIQVPFWDVITCMENNIGSLRRDMIPMYMLGRVPDYIDPENYVTPLYSNRSEFWVNTYDYELEQLMLEGELTIDITTRQMIYNEIQRKLVEELYFHVWIATGKNYDVYQNYVKGWVPNAIERLDLYPVYIDY